ncbi:hypothetical protein AAHE18_19G129400 [Arachis hypogaea]
MIPLEQESVVLTEATVNGLVLVDIINGFYTVSSGNLAPREANKQISGMINKSERLARLFCEKKFSVMAFLDSHHPNKSEDPYPPHCIVGSDESNLVLENESNVTIKRKDCFDGYLGSIEEDISNVFVDWVKKNKINSVCTDICMLDFMCSTMSAKNRGFLEPLKSIVVYSRGCTTFDIPLEVAYDTKGTLAHPQSQWNNHYCGYYPGGGIELKNQTTFQKD